MTTAMWQPTLEGTLLRLQPLAASAWGRLFAVASDPLIWEQHHARNRLLGPVFHTCFDEAMASRGAFLVLEAATGATIGWTRFTGHDADARTIEVGHAFLARSH